MAHPCVDKYSNNQREERIYHKYYQWVYFVLFFQACGFYGPHLLWKTWESSLLRQLTIDLDLKDPLASNDKHKDAIRRVSRYFIKSRLRHEQYFRLFTLCEVMNLFNVIIQIYLVDEFLGGTFTTYGLDVLDYVQLDQTDRVDPMVRVFPRMTKCTFHRFGSSGDVQRYDSLCILPLNIINEKIYIIMWFWFVFLAIVTTIWLIYRLATHTKLEVRFRVLSRRASLADKKYLRYALKKMEAGDWFVLSMMCKNMESHPFRLLIEELSRQLRLLSLDRKRAQGKSSSQNGNGRGLYDEKWRIIENNEGDSEIDELELEAGAHGQPVDSEVSSTEGDGSNLDKVAIKS